MPRREINPPRRQIVFHDEAERREAVADLHLKGFTNAAIARALDIHPSTVKADVRAIDLHLQTQAVPNMTRSLNRAMYSLRQVMAESWAIVGNLSDEKQNKVGALNTILAAEQQLQKLEGLSAPDSLNAAALAEIQETMMRVLEKVGGVDLQRAFLTELGLASQTSLGQYIASTVAPLPPRETSGLVVHQAERPVAPFERGDQDSGEGALPPGIEQTFFSWSTPSQEEDEGGNADAEQPSGEEDEPLL